MVIYLIENNTIQPNLATYQFTYFSLYYIFFALLPMPYPGGSSSDGKIILDLIRNKKQGRELIAYSGTTKRSNGVY
ncbi:hypothetical protein [Pontibacter rugosus]